MKRLELALGKISDVSDKFSRVLLMIIVAVMVSVILLQVLCRYVFKAPLIWPEEVTTFLMAWMAFIGSAVAIKSSGHIGIVILLNSLSGKTKIIVQLIGRLAVAAFVAVFFYQSIFFISQSTQQVSMALQISMAYPRLSLAVGAALMIIHLLYFIVKDFNELIQGEG